MLFKTKWAKKQLFLYHCIAEYFETNTLGSPSTVFYDMFLKNSYKFYLFHHTSIQESKLLSLSLSLSQ